MPTVDDMIKKLFCDRGLQEAASVKVQFKSGQTITIHSDDHPALQRDADEVAEVTPQQTAQGGC